MSQWLIAVFMLAAGVNFVLLYRALVRRRPAALARDEEFRLYGVITVAASVALVVQLWAYGIAEGEEAVRLGVFQAVSVITTTGFATANFALWPILCLLTIFALMFAGGSAGSTTGSIKIVRHLLLGKVLRRELDQTVSPEVVMPVRFNRRPVDERTLRGITTFILLYVGIWAIGASIIAIDSAISGVPLNALDTIAVSASALGNGGPGFGITGPFGSFAAARGRLQGDDDRPHVARQARDRPGGRLADPPLLAGLSATSPRAALCAGRARIRSRRRPAPDRPAAGRCLGRRAPSARGGRRR